jgi:tetratricopeptide (TPR) repeat protein
MSWAIAAGVVLALLTVAIVFIARRNEPVRELAATARQAGVRTFEGRLSNFDYAPYRAERTPGAPGGTAITAAANGVLSENTPKSAAQWRAAGVAYLFLGRAEEAARALARATQLAPESAEYRSDLAAARIALGTAREDPNELRRAIADADDALRLDPASAAAHFNRAVALDRLGQTWQAARAYSEYLAIDRTSSWADEARWRLERLGH